MQLRDQLLVIATVDKVAAELSSCLARHGRGQRQRRHEPERVRRLQGARAGADPLVLQEARPGHVHAEVR